PPRLLHTLTGKPIGEPLAVSGGYRECAAFSPDGKRLAIGSILVMGKERKGELRLFDATTGKPLGPAVEYPSAATCLAFSPAGTRIVMGHADRQARFADGATGAPSGAPLDGGGTAQANRYSSRVAFSPDGRTVLTLNEKVIRLWDAATGKMRGKSLQ